jgi:hypothetical protein
VRVRPRHTLSVLAVLAAAATAFSVGAPAATAADRLPDLGMARLHSFHITNQYGMRLLRFGTDVVNVGVGPFEVIGAGASSSEWPWTTQRVFNDAGGHQDWAVPATMFYSGDGHDHRHVRDLLTMELTPQGGANVVGTVAKIGYCFYDNVRYRLSLPGAPRSVRYGSSSCGNYYSTSVKMGLSVGWGDRYPWNIAYQYIDISRLAVPGNYRLTVTADKQNWFRETNDTNNATWVDLYLNRPGYSSRILGYGPSA